jgi:hypothetical protein
LRPALSAVIVLLHGTKDDEFFAHTSGTGDGVFCSGEREQSASSGCKASLRTFLNFKYSQVRMCAIAALEHSGVHLAGRLRVRLARPAEQGNNGTFPGLQSRVDEEVEASSNLDVTR